MGHTGVVIVTIILCAAVVIGVVWLIAHAGIARGLHFDRHMFHHRRRLVADPHVDEDSVVR